MYKQLWYLSSTLSISLWSQLYPPVSRGIVSGEEETEHRNSSGRIYRAFTAPGSAIAKHNNRYIKSVIRQCCIFIVVIAQPGVSRIARVSNEPTFFPPVRSPIRTPVSSWRAAISRFDDGRQLVGSDESVNSQMLICAADLIGPAPLAARSQTARRLGDLAHAVRPLIKLLADHGEVASLTRPWRSPGI